MERRIAITGAAGRIGSQLRNHLGGALGYELVLIDRESGGDAEIFPADLAQYTPEWSELFSGVDSVLHLAGDARPRAPWSSVADNNVEATFNVFRAAAEQGVRRVIYASTLMSMEGYRFGRGPIAFDALPRPVSFYAASKLMGEAIARQFAQERGISVICLRFGAVQSRDAPPGRDWTDWTHSKWLSAEDLCQAVEKAILAENVSFAILPLASDNPGMRWDLSETRRVLGYSPTKSTPLPGPPLHIKIRSLLGLVHKRFFDPTWRYYWD